MSTQPQTPPRKVRVAIGGSKKPKPNGHAANLASPLTAADLGMLRDTLKIPEALSAKAHICRVTHQQAVALGFKYKPHSQLQGVVFWYLTRDGQLNGGARLRRDVPDLDDRGRPDAKYLTLPGTQRVPYLLPEDYERLAKNPEARLVAVESEKAKLAGMAWAARAGRHDVVFMAVGGNYGWLHKPDDAENSYPLPVLKELLANRRDTLWYDSNVATNPAVQAARLRLAVYAHLECNGEVDYAALPLEDGVNGPDDYLARHGDKAFGQLLDNTQPAYAEPFASVEDIEKAEPPEFVTDGLIQTQGSTVIGGLSSHGKTWILLLIIQALLDTDAAKLFGYFKVMRRPKRVVYISPEATLGALKCRVQALGLMKYVKEKRLLLQGISADPLSLTDPRLLMAARDAVVVLDPFIRFLDGDEKSNTDVSRSVSTPLFALLGAGAMCVVMGHHAPKAFGEAKYMSLENMLRGGGDIGALFSGAWGVRKMAESNADKLLIHIENLKPRDFTPLEPFEIVGAPWRDGKMAMWMKPGECPYLNDRLPSRPGRPRSEGKQQRMQTIAEMVKEGKTDAEIVAALASTGTKASTLRKDISNARRRKY